MQKQNKFISSRKERPFPGISGRRWERTGLQLFTGNKRGDWPGAVCGSQRTPPQGESGQALAGQGLTKPRSQTRVLASQLENLYLDEVDGEGEGAEDCVRPWP